MKLSKRVQGIVAGGDDGWGVLYEAKRLKAAGEDIIMLSIGDHDFDTPAPIVAAAKQALDTGKHHYSDLYGIPRLRKILAERAKEFTGAPAKIENIIATPGGQGALYMAAQAVLDPGDHTILIETYYATFDQTMRAAGCQSTLISTRPEDGFQPRVEDIAAAIRPNTKMILINTPNNPSGAIYSRETLMGISELCIKHDIWLVSDEVYWCHAHAAEHISPRGLPGMMDRTIVTNSFSKSHAMTGWRLGWITAPKEVINNIYNLVLVMLYGLPEFIQEAAAFAMEERAGEAEIQAVYRHRRTLMTELLTPIKGTRISASEGGMYVLLDVRALGLSGNDFADRLLASVGVGTMPGESFGASAAGHIRLTLCADDDMLREAAARIARFVGTLNYSESAK